MSDQVSYYLKLQFRRIGRFLKYNGLSPFLACPLALILFAFGSFYILSEISFGEFIYTGLAISLLSTVISDRRYTFLTRLHEPKTFNIIRFGEAGLIMIPFLLFLFCFGFWQAAILLFILGFLTIYIRGRWNLPYTIPTPFAHRPFEFIRGYRIALLPILGSYLLMLIGISVDNFNLALASMAFIGLICGYFLMYPEPRIFVWVYSMPPLEFLLAKCKTVILNTIILILPISLILLGYDTSRYWSILLMMIICLAFVLMSMLAKYVVFPTEINLIQGFAIGFSILFPPLMILIIPVFFWKASQRLKRILAW